MRGWLNDIRSYMEPIKIGAVMRSMGIGRVIASKSKDFAPGDLVSGDHSLSNVKARLMG